MPLSPESVQYGYGYGRKYGYGSKYGKHGYGDRAEAERKKGKKEVAESVG